MLIHNHKHLSIGSLGSAYANKSCVSIRHEDNFQLLNILLPIKMFEGRIYCSSIENKPRLIVKVINKYKYTTELEFCYDFESAQSEKIIVKLYHDAKVAEIVYCTDVQQFIRLMGPRICPKIHKQTRNVLNVFLNKWLNYLLKNGYSRNSWST